VGTVVHTLLATFQGNTIQVSYDGVQYINVTDNGFDSVPAFTSGGISLDMYLPNTPYVMTVENISVLAQPLAAVNDTYSMAQNTTLNVAAPGVLANDSGASLTATVVSQPTQGTLTLNSDGSFSYTPQASFSGTASFTYEAISAGVTSNIATVTITVTPTGLSSATLNPVIVNGGSPTQGTVTLSGPASGSGTVVSLASSNPSLAAVSPSVTVAAGSTSATFTVTTGTPAVVTPAAITASLSGTSQSATLTVAPAGSQVLVSSSGGQGQWVTELGSWSALNGAMEGSSSPGSYAIAYVNGNWMNYSVEGQIQFPAGAYGGGIGGRVNTTTGARYGVWVYPEGSAGGSSVVQVIKFQDWTTWSGTFGTPMAQASLPGVGTVAHTLLVTFQGNTIQVYYDAVQYINVTDNGFGSVPAYTIGGVSLDMYTDQTSYVMSVANITALAPPPVAQNEVYSMVQGTTLSVAAPGVLANDSGGSSLTAAAVTQPAQGTLTLNADGSFSYTPQSSFVGTDSFTYQASAGGVLSNVATVTITVNYLLFSDAFSGSGADPLWTTELGSWNVANGMMTGSSPVGSYGYAYLNASWTNYSVQAQIQFPAGGYGGGIGGQVNTATGAHYGIWVYPEGSAGGSSVLKVMKFEGWSTWSGTPLAVASLPGVGTAWHTVVATFQGNTIQVSYDAVQYINVTDSGFDSVPAYTSGGVSLDMYTDSPYLLNVENFSVLTLQAGPVAQNDSYSMVQGTTLNVAAPGVLANDSGSSLTAILVSQPQQGTLTLNSDGSFSYTPQASFTGTDSFTYQASAAGVTSNVATVTITVTPTGM
jgi:hypothetical protein